MIRQSSVYHETINQKSQTENDFLVIKRVSASFYLYLVCNDFIYAKKDRFDPKTIMQWINRLFTN